MKIFNVVAFPVASVLVLTGGLLATRDMSTVETKPQAFHYTSSWGTQSFDEAVWMAVDDIARIEDTLPPEVDNFELRIKSSSGEMPSILIQFNRASLIGLKVGAISPENFMRVHVTFS